MTIIEKVYLNRNNTIDLLLKADGVPVNLASVDRMVLVNSEKEILIDSDISPDAFDWNTDTTGKLILSLGGEELPIGSHLLCLIVYDVDNPDGIVWEIFRCIVKNNCIGN